MDINEINPVLQQAIVDVVLSKTEAEKITLLEDAFDQGFGVFWGVAQILLDAPCGDGGGLPTEVINGVFERKLDKANE